MTTIRDVLEELGIAYREHGEHHHVSDGWIGIDCPFCAPDTSRFRLGINLSNLWCSCWVCGLQRLGAVLAAASGRSLSEVLKILPDSFPTSPQADDLPSGRYKPPPGLGPLVEAHRNYLSRRGFDPDQLVAEYRVGAIGHLGGQYSWRLFFPVELQGKPVSWTTRSIGGRNVAKYVSASRYDEDVPLKTLLYGADRAGHAVVVVEGPLDAIRIGPGAVSTFGVVVTRAQVRKLAKYPVRLICFDNEPEARRRADALADQLASFPGQTSVIRLSAKDPAEADSDEIEEIRKMIR